MNNQAHSPVFIEWILTKYNRIYFNNISAGGNMMNKLLMSVKTWQLVNDGWRTCVVLMILPVCMMVDECANGLMTLSVTLLYRSLSHYVTDPRILFVLLMKFVIMSASYGSHILCVGHE